MIYILAPRTSQSAKQLAEACGYRHIWNGRRQPRDFVGATIINYGYSGRKYNDWRHNVSIREGSKILNHVSGIRKDYAIQRVSEAGVSCPETADHIDQVQAEQGNWIFKPYRSAQGRGIIRVNGDEPIPNGVGYFQKEVLNREYEIRVSAFNWRDQADWGVWKRTCTDHGQLCWNHHQGGRFITIRRPTRWRVFRDAIAASQIVLDTLNMDFGAVDFILDSERRVQFIEINSRPGFTEIGRQIYVEAFQALADAQPQASVETMPEEQVVCGMSGESSPLSSGMPTTDPGAAPEVEQTDWLLNQVREAQRMIHDGLRMVADGERRLNQLTQT